MLQVSSANAAFSQIAFQPQSQPNSISMIRTSSTSTGLAPRNATGQVRICTEYAPFDLLLNFAEHGRLRRLRYEAYRPMAERVLNDLAARAAEQFDCLGVRIHHALGEVAVGQASVLVQVMCSHRGEAFAACRFLIDALKKEAPIWKREEWADGTSWSEGAVVETPDTQTGTMPIRESR